MNVGHSCLRILGDSNVRNDNELVKPYDFTPLAMGGAFLFLYLMLGLIITQEAKKEDQESTSIEWSLALSFCNSVTVKLAHSDTES
mgnify:CR=1 FL=1